MLKLMLLGVLIGIVLGCGGVSSEARSGCDPSYPDICVSPPPPDLDCGDLSKKNFKVLRPDPHGFDRDRDGVGCEG